MALGSDAVFPGQWASWDLEMPLYFLQWGWLYQTWLPLVAQGTQVFSQTILVNSWLQNSDFLALKLTENSFLCNWQDWSPTHPTIRESRPSPLKGTSVLHGQERGPSSSWPLGMLGRLEGLCLLFYYCPWACKCIWIDAVLDILWGFEVQRIGVSPLFSYCISLNKAFFRRWQAPGSQEIWLCVSDA